MTSRKTFGSAGGAGNYVPLAPLSRRAPVKRGAGPSGWTQKAGTGASSAAGGRGRHRTAHDLEASPRRPIGSSLGFGD